MQLIDSARHMLYITTPYYALEESMQQALCIAADAGVDVRAGSGDSRQEIRLYGGGDLLRGNC
ncbi:MAG: hypothetical protein V8R75_16495 [Oscillospiraceae bacterium]